MASEFAAMPLVDHALVIALYTSGLNGAGDTGLETILTLAPWISFECLGVSLPLWVWSAFTPIRDAIDYVVGDIQRAARRNAAASLFAAIAFFVQAIAYGVPAWVADMVLRLATGSQAKAGIGRWITFYNHRRHHAAHGGQPPDVVYFNSIETDQQVQAGA